MNFQCHLILPGSVIDVVYPFVQEEQSIPDYDEGQVSKTILTWRPGVKTDEDGDMIADRMGHMKLTIEAVYRPGKFPTRVFFTRKWVDPEGKEFGKNKLHIRTLGSFRQLLNGYRHHFTISESFVF